MIKLDFKKKPAADQTASPIFFQPSIPQIEPHASKPDFTSMGRITWSNGFVSFVFLSWWSLRIPKDPPIWRVFPSLHLAGVIKVLKMTPGLWGWSGCFSGLTFCCTGREKNRQCFWHFLEFFAKGKLKNKSVSWPLPRPPLAPHVWQEALTPGAGKKPP